MTGTRNPATPPDGTTGPRIHPGKVAATALTTAALTLPDPATLTPARRHLLRLGRAGVVGWYGWELTRRAPVHALAPVNVVPLVGAAAGAALTLATAPVDEATDRWSDRTLRRLGVRRPRLVLAAVGAAVGAALALDAQTASFDTDDDPIGPEDFFETLEAVPAPARVLIEAMLDAAPPGFEASAQILREQLETAGASVLKDEPGSTDVFITVPEGGPRAVPYAQTWPVHGELEVAGIPVTLELQIGEGRLASLSMMMGEDATEEQWELDLQDHVQGWPTPDEVRWVVETA